MALCLLLGTFSTGPSDEQRATYAGLRTCKKYMRKDTPPSGRARVGLVGSSFQRLALTLAAHELSMHGRILSRQRGVLTWREPVGVVTSPALRSGHKTIRIERRS